MATKKEAKTQESDEKNNSFPFPRPIIIESSPLSSSYFQKLPPLSPRSMKMIDPNYQVGSEDFRRKSPAELSTRGSSCSAESTASSIGSDYLTTSSEVGNAFEFQRKPSDSLESSANDIHFFLQVVDVFKEYLADQITLLEAQYAENYRQQQCLQKTKKKCEEQAYQNENRLSRDIAMLITTLHQKQVELKSVLQKQNREAMQSYREQEDRCRKNMKLISELLAFAKRIRSESSETLKQNSVREFKDRLACINDLGAPDFLQSLSSSTRIDVNLIKNYLMNIGLQENNEYLNGEDSISSDESRPIFIKAPLPVDDISKSHITVRWCSQRKDSMYDIQWRYVRKGKVIEKKSDNISDSVFVIDNLPSNCDVIVKIRHSTEKIKWSEPAKFKTLEAPAEFIFDSTTAHIKLRLTTDKRTVFFGGNDKSSPKSPSRFSFALNVLGNQAFFTGRHYWEMKVNQDGWACGVAYQGVPRNSWLGSNPESWILHHNPAKFGYKVRHAGEACEVDPDLSKPSDFLKKIGIYLDVDGGIISFVDPSKERILYTYTVDRFDEPVCAAANPFYNGGRLTLLSGLDVPKYLGEL